MLKFIVQTTAIHISEHDHTLQDECGMQQQLTWQ